MIKKIPLVNFDKTNPMQDAITQANTHFSSMKDSILRHDIHLMIGHGSPDGYFYFRKSLRVNIREFRKHFINSKKSIADYRFVMCYMDKPEDGQGKQNLPVRALISVPRLYIGSKNGECTIEFQPRNVTYYY